MPKLGSREGKAAAAAQTVGSRRCAAQPFHIVSQHANSGCNPWTAHMSSKKARIVLLIALEPNLPTNLNGLTQMTGEAHSSTLTATTG